MLSLIFLLFIVLIVSYFLRDFIHDQLPGAFDNPMQGGETLTYTLKEGYGLDYKCVEITVDKNFLERKYFGSVAVSFGLDRKGSVHNLSDEKTVDARVVLEASEMAALDKFYKDLYREYHIKARTNPKCGFRDLVIDVSLPDIKHSKGFISDYYNCLSRRIPAKYN